MPSRSTKSSNNEDKTLKKLRELALQPESGWDLLWRHKVGELVERLCPAFDRAYGQGQIEGLAKELRGAISPDMLWKTRKFYGTYTRSDVQKLVKITFPGGRGLTWFHIVALCTIDDYERPEWQETCIKEGWSYAELELRIKQSRAPKSQGGRKFKRPKDVESALRQLIDESHSWHKRFRDVWFHEDHPAIQFEPAKYKSQEVGALAADAVGILERLQFEIEEALVRVKALRVPAKETKAKPKPRTRKRG